MAWDPWWHGSQSKDEEQLSFSVNGAWQGGAFTLPRRPPKGGRKGGGCGGKGGGGGEEGAFDPLYPAVALKNGQVRLNYFAAVANY